MGKRIEDLRVLVIDDDKNVRSTIRSMLLEMSVKNIKESDDGKMAMELLETDILFPDLIVCDWNMPHKNGLELLREVRQTNPNIPFLMITARADAESVMAAKEADVTAYIRKPFSYQDFCIKIERMLH